MIRDQDKWPCWPYLPVKKAGKAHLGVEGKCLGLLLATEELVNQGKPTVYYVSLYDVPKDLASAPKKEYPTVEALLDDGWVVD